MSARWRVVGVDGDVEDGFRYPQSIVLENLSFPFAKPNILDVKLGTVLYDEDAPPEKVARMEKTARDTTSFETGIRLTGFQVRSFSCLKISNTKYIRRYTIISLLSLLSRRNRTESPLSPLISQKELLAFSLLAMWSLRS
jgi:hypothetical protein